MLDQQLTFSAGATAGTVSPNGSSTVHTESIDLVPSEIQLAAPSAAPHVTSMPPQILPPPSSIGVEPEYGVVDCCINESRPYWCYRGRLVSFSPYEHSMRQNYIGSFKLLSVSDRTGPLLWFYLFLGYFISYLTHQIMLMCLFGANTVVVLPESRELHSGSQMYIYLSMLPLLGIVGCISFTTVIPNVGILTVLHILVYVSLGILMTGLTILLWDETLFTMTVSSSFFVIMYGLIVSFFQASKRTTRGLMISILVIYLIVPIVIAYFNKFDVFYYMFVVGIIQAGVLIYGIYIKECQLHPIIASYKPFCDIVFIPCFVVLMLIYLIFALLVKAIKGDFSNSNRQTNNSNFSYQSTSPGGQSQNIFGFQPRTFRQIQPKASSKGKHNKARKSSSIAPRGRGDQKASPATAAISSATNANNNKGTVRYLGVKSVDGDFN